MNQVADKTNVGILFGGRSAEHEVSLQSAKNVIGALDRSRFRPVLVGIDKRGRWWLLPEDDYLLNADDPSAIALSPGGEAVLTAPWSEGGRLRWAHGSSRRAQAPRLDVVFPILHGPFGEDGTLQGLWRLAGVPVVGAGVLGSAAGMDKDVMKRLFRDAGLPIARFRVLFAGDARPSFEELVRELGRPFYVKPANMGSSVGVHRVEEEEEWAAALKDALLFDRKLVLEENVEGQEVECAVLGNREAQASGVGEIVPTHDFYSYQAKYIDSRGAELRIPAGLPDEVANSVRQLAIQAFRAVGCRGLARVDFFVRPEGRPVLNEINTLPGFTQISMYPKLWQAAGVPYSELISRLIDLAREDFAERSRLRTSYF